MKQLLAIDTTTEACSVALVFNKNGDEKFLSRYQLAPRLHAELILAMIDEVLEEAELKLEQLDAIAVTIGPGAFTGVRLGVAVAQGLAFSSALKVIPVNTLEVLALGAAESVELTDCHIAVAMDARMNEVYWGCFEYNNKQLCKVTEQVVIAPSKITTGNHQINSNWNFAGTGWLAYQQQFEELLGFKVVCREQWQLPTAESVLSLALQNFDQATEAELLSPLYLRDKVAETIIQRQARKLASTEFSKN